MALRAVLLVIAGPNGAGKTTVTKRLRTDHWDDIARDRFGDWNSPDAVARAANWAANRREELLVAKAGIDDAIAEVPHDDDFPTVP